MMSNFKKGALIFHPMNNAYLFEGQIVIDNNEEIMN